MQPHRLLLHCGLRDQEAAHCLGVGACLYQEPPGYVGAAQPDVLLCTRQHMDRMCTYDVNQLNSRLLLAQVAANVSDNTEVDWRSGEHFPWWVWLANTGAIRDAVGGGIFSFRVRVTNKKVLIGVHSTNGRHEITFPGRAKKAIVRMIDCTRAWVGDASQLPGFRVQS